VKRSRSIRLVLIGGIAAGVATGCGPGSQPPLVSPENVYTNNYHVPGVGYYHAPYRAFFALPYNHFDVASQRYFHGGQWSTVPAQNITNISSPTADVASLAEAQRSDVVRGGFGHTSRSHSIWS
jgi:hypothetical protein